MFKLAFQTASSVEISDVKIFIGDKFKITVFIIINELMGARQDGF